eukprot:6098253-Ditylum_brightwellii.AAC.1
MVLTPDQIAVIAAAAINATGLGANAETFSDNPFVDNIKPGTKNCLALFNDATPSVPLDKRIDLTTTNSQKVMDIFDNLNTRYQWIKLMKQVPDRESGGAVALQQRNNK